MNKWVILIAGFITGCILTSIVAVMCVALHSNNSNFGNENQTNSNIRIAPKPVPFTESASFEVFHVFEDGALARCEEDYGYHGMTVLLPNNDSIQYYNDQIIEVPEGKQAMQTGTFRYGTGISYKVVPIIEFE